MKSATEHKIKYDGTSGHNGEDWYKCSVCKVSDWIAHYGEYEQLNFFYTPCIPPVKLPEQQELF